jgi:rubrerythrin
MRRRMMQRMRIRGVFSSMFAPMSENNSLKYYCMSCGIQHKDISCPNCGSKMKKVGY